MSKTEAAIFVILPHSTGLSPPPRVMEACDILGQPFQFVHMPIHRLPDPDPPRVAGSPTRRSSAPQLPQAEGDHADRREGHGSPINPAKEVPALTAGHGSSPASRGASSPASEGSRFLKS